MAIINFIWDGKTKTPAGSTTNYYQGASNGYFRPTGYSEEWTGSNLTYYFSDSVLPTSGTLNSYTHVREAGVFSWSITGLSTVIPANSTYELLIQEMVKGKDDWYGNSLNNFFYFSVGGDTYHGGDGIDTVDMFLKKSQLVTSTTKYTKQTNGNIQVGFVNNITVNLDSVERVKFSDVSIALDIDGNAGKAAKVLGAVFGASSLSNKDFVGIALSFLDAGMEYKTLLDLALTAKLGQNYTAEAEIKLLYSNVFNIVPGTSTLEVLKGLIDNNYCSKSELAHIISESSNNQLNVNLIGLAQTGIEYIPFE